MYTKEEFDDNAYGKKYSCGPVPRQTLSCGLMKDRANNQGNTKGERRNAEHVLQCMVQRIGQSVREISITDHKIHSY